jgi:hypothetical protein
MSETSVLVSPRPSSGHRITSGEYETKQQQLNFWKTEFGRGISAINTGQEAGLLARHLRPGRNSSSAMPMIDLVFIHANQRKNILAQDHALESCKRALGTLRMGPSPPPFWRIGQL